jgi:hypothetical protein
MNILYFKKVKYVYILFGLVFESLAHEVDVHVCSFFSLSTNLSLRSVCVCNTTT